MLVEVFLNTINIFGPKEGYKEYFQGQFLFLGRKKKKLKDSLFMLGTTEVTRNEGI